ncbi:MAG: rod shape-determining protein MreD [SAR324 cluster bacterium]|nr:rod shape-determining protein MreD [SAR324 cluster bacterium]
MTHLHWWISGIFGLWVQIALSHYMRIIDLKINIVLIVLLVMTLRWKSPFLLFYGLALGLMSDASSHSLIGINGLSFFLTLILTRWFGEWFYDKNVISTVFFVGILSVIEGGIALILLKLLTPDFPWNLLFFQKVVPLSVIHGLVSPFFLWALTRFERFLHLKPEEKLP